MRDYRIAEETVVVVKLSANEDVVTYQRIKQRVKAWNVFFFSR